MAAADDKMPDKKPGMPEKNMLVFLGTGGGGYVMYTQVRKTGGMYCQMDGTKFIIDPGPGALLLARQAGIKLEKLDGIFLSHFHSDHSTDANVIIGGDDEVMGKKKFLVCQKYCIRKWRDDYPCITTYHQKKVDVHPVAGGEKLELAGLKIQAFKSDHYVPAAGFRITGKSGFVLSYPSDGPYFRQQSKYYDSSDLLVLNILTPHPVKPMPHKHMSVDNAIELVNGMKHKPKAVIMQHFSFYMMRHGLNKQAAIFRKATGVPCIAARDGMIFDLEKMKPADEAGLKKFV